MIGALMTLTSKIARAETRIFDGSFEIWIGQLRRFESKGSYGGHSILRCLVDLYLWSVSYVRKF
jgi:hypothetical protein